MSEDARDVPLDVVIVGAGLSGIGAAHRLQTHLPSKRFVILESRDAVGGTWDLFRYPGVRSDSDMFTLGYPFRPWPGAAAMADGAAIRDYIRDTARAAGLDRKILFHHRLCAASWSSRTACWTLQIAHGDRVVVMNCRFLFLCAGYYDADAGYTPAFRDVERFRGRIVHPQHWPDDLDTCGKSVAIIGSGATAVTLAPALVAQGARVTLVQRSPSYVVALPSQDRFARILRRWLPDKLAYGTIRWRNILLSALFYRYARWRPTHMRAYLLARARRHLGDRFDVGLHFDAPYKPWDQRLCVAPDGDLFDVLKNGSAAIVTEEIDGFTPDGLRLQSGRTLDADVVVTATGLRLKLVGGVALEVDGRPVDLAQTMSYKGAMFSGVPNLAYALGYTNASWTLRSDLTSTFVCRVLAYMDKHGHAACVARHQGSISQKPLIDLTSGYIRRAQHLLPKQGDRGPWRLKQNYLTDSLTLRLGAIDDGFLIFSTAA